ncbi:hypothetical protein SAMN05421810_10264 [Amycolatopsis arida]|uniref:Uncharacterized protein n=1 Tax=Amycolatopsis arida TaxID=587909 RepID=A0A1I5NX84_9PSEU|nr:hypothetical protein [Amycolatopsis arida]TDX98275.1 hypothetical protein CLV69_10164 [Amycolatopsis arida]SFP26383.1 hypothetical protein SAMN05421810_10264 [Amycolatopsis arida]
MIDWCYSTASRCCHCDQRACFPDERTADRFVTKSERRLVSFACPVGNGWHVIYPAVELKASVPRR